MDRFSIIKKQESERIYQKKKHDNIITFKYVEMRNKIINNWQI